MQQGVNLLELIDCFFEMTFQENHGGVFVLETAQQAQQDLLSEASVRPRFLFKYIRLQHLPNLYRI